jgi:hypothetical protein
MGEVRAPVQKANAALAPRRCFAVDVQQCPKCLGRLRVISHIDDSETARAILDRLGMPTWGSEDTVALGSLA